MADLESETVVAASKGCNDMQPSCHQILRRDNDDNLSLRFSIVNCGFLPSTSTTIVLSTSIGEHPKTGYIGKHGT